MKATVSVAHSLRRPRLAAPISSHPTFQSVNYAQLLLSGLCVYLLPTTGPLHMPHRIAMEGWRFSDVLSSYGPMGSRQGYASFLFIAITNTVTEAI